MLNRQNKVNSIYHMSSVLTYFNRDNKLTQISNTAVFRDFMVVLLQLIFWGCDDYFFQWTFRNRKGLH